MPGGKHLCTLFIVSALSWFASHPGFAQTLGPVQAELMQRLDAGRVKVGDPILAKLQVAWKSPTCDLRTGAIIEGHVVTQRARSKIEKISQIGVIFEKGQCSGLDMKPLSLTVAAIVAPLGYTDNPGVEELQPLSSAVGLTLNGNVSGPGGAGNMVRSVTQAADTAFSEPRPSKVPSTLKPGQVVGIPHLAISVGQGEGGASILSSRGRDVKLSPGTRFLLVPNLRAETAEAAAPKADPPTDPIDAEAILDAPDIANETQLCTAPDCSVASADSRIDERTHGEQMSLQLKDLGYVSRTADREMSSFGYDPSISYLGPNQFLFTFNPHTLVPRTDAEAHSFRKLRLVRGVLIDLEKNQIVKTVDWRVPDSGQYLWPIAQNQLLIHVGQELRVYGPGLTLRNQVFLGGELAFLRISPSSDYFAAGVIHERHPREIHQQLAEADLRDPEEDVEIRVFDSQFRLLTTVTRSSRMAPPVLMNEGEIRIPTIGRNRWRIVEDSWAGQRLVLATATSSCVPEAESLPGNLLFVLGCDRQTGNRWYRVLHGDGKVVLKGWTSSSELEQTAGGNVGNNVFAIRIAETIASRIPGAVFKPSDLKSARVTLYRATDGRRVFSIGLPDPATAVQTFAISPREDQLAVLTASQIAFYRVAE